VGYVVILLQRAFGRNEVKPKWHLERSMWIPVYLIGMGLILLFSSFGPTSWEANPSLPFGWDILVTAIFSLIIYYWAVASALPSEEIQEMVDTLVIPEDSELAEAPLAA